MRLLNKEKSKLILKYVSNRLYNSPFLFQYKWAIITSGQEEGAYGWLAYNYLMKIIGPKKTKNISPYAVVEMGGASVQVTQIALTKKDSDSIPLDYKITINIEKDVYNLYTHSYLGYGSDRAREIYNEKLLQINKNHFDKNNNDNNSKNSKNYDNNDNIEVHDPCLYRGYSRDILTTRKNVFDGPAGRIHLTGGTDQTTNRLVWCM